MARVAEVLVFGLTPRAGRRHHVYLVPTASHSTQDRIHELAAQVNEAVASAYNSIVVGPDFVVVWEFATQDTTGRRGRQWLCVASRWPGSVRFEPTQNGQEWLRAKLSDLNAIVAGRSWGNAGPLMEPLPEFDQWQREAQGRLEAFGRPDGLAKPNVPGHTRQRGLARRPRGRLLAAVCLAAGLVLMASAAFLPGCRKWIQDWRKRIWDPPPAQQRFAALANALGLSGQPDTARIVEKLRELFEPPAQPKNRLHDKEKEIENLLQSFEKEMGRPGTDALETLLKSRELMKPISSLFQKGEFNPVALLDENKDFWKGVTPRQVALLQNAVLTHKPDGSSGGWNLAADVRNHLGERYKDYYEVLHHLAGFPSRECPVRDRRFFLPRDKNDLQLRELKTSLEDLSKTCSQNKGQTCRECLEAVFELYGSQGKQRDAAQNDAQTEKEKENDAKAKYFSQRLEQFLKVVDDWEKILKDGSTN